MKVGLVDCDSHNFPNLPLMKIASYHRQKGNQVEFAKMGTYYDLLYVSKIFTESPEPKLPEAGVTFFGGSGYDLETQLPYEVEHSYPDYDLYPDLTRDTAYGFLTRGCPRKNHGFCITPKKDGCISRKNADLSEFWHGQKNIILLDQNLLACSERMDLLKQLSDSRASVDFNGGLDVRYLNDDILHAFQAIKVKEYRFAWDDPTEDLREQFQLFVSSRITSLDHCRVYVLTNYNSSMEENLFRIYSLVSMGLKPFVMIYNKQKYVDDRGRWLPDVAKRFSEQELRNFKVCQFMQRWCARIWILKSCPNFIDYQPYKNWINKGMPVPKSL